MRLILLTVILAALRPLGITFSFQSNELLALLPFYHTVFLPYFLMLYPLFLLPKDCSTLQFLSLKIQS